MTRQRGPFLAQFPDGRPILCVICGFNKFGGRQVKLNTTGAEFFGVEWMNARALALICQNCSYIQEFANMKLIQLFDTE